MSTCLPQTDPGVPAAGNKRRPVGKGGSRSCCSAGPGGNNPWGQIEGSKQGFRWLGEEDISRGRQHRGDRGAANMLQQRCPQQREAPAAPPPDPGALEQEISRLPSALCSPRASLRRMRRLGPAPGLPARAVLPAGGVVACWHWPAAEPMGRRQLPLAGGESGGCNWPAVSQCEVGGRG